MSNPLTDIRLRPFRRTPVPCACGCGLHFVQKNSLHLYAKVTCRKFVERRRVQVAIENERATGAPSAGAIPAPAVLSQYEGILLAQRDGGFTFAVASNSFPPDGWHPASPDVAWAASPNGQVWNMVFVGAAQPPSSVEADGQPIQAGDSVAISVPQAPSSVPPTLP